jgi:hypothetical protein
MGQQLSTAFHFERSYCFHPQAQADILILQHCWNCSPSDTALHPRKCGFVPQQHHCQNVQSRTVLQLLQYTWSATLEVPCCTFAYLTVQLLIERQRKCIVTLNGNEVWKTGTDKRVNMNRPQCWLCVLQLTVFVFQKVWMDCAVAVVVATWDLSF